MRGETTLFKSSNKPQKKQRKNTGRSSVLIAERNKAICNRYYFYTTFFPFKYDVVIKLVSADFYLAPYTVIELLAKNNAVLKAVKSNKPTIETLSKVYLQQNWNISDAQQRATALIA